MAITKYRRLKSIDFNLLANKRKPKNNMRILKETPTYAEAKYVAYKADDAKLTIELKAPGYLVEDITVKKHKNGVNVAGKPRKDAGRGSFAPGFTNFFPIEDEKQYDFSKTEDLVKLENGILIVTLPIAKEFQAVTLKVK